MLPKVMQAVVKRKLEGMEGLYILNGNGSDE